MDAANGIGSAATDSFTIVVDQAPAVTSAAATAFTTGTAGSFTVTDTGFPTPTLAETGALPSGVTFNAASGIVSGTPAAGSGGSYGLLLVASNGIGTSATQDFTLVVDQPPVLTSAAGATFTVGTVAGFQVADTGYPVPSLSASAPCRAASPSTPQPVPSAAHRPRGRVAPTT